MRSVARPAAQVLGLMAVLAGATIAKAGTVDGMDPQGPKHAGLNAQQAMLWKYTARCALRSDQELEAPAGPDGQKPKFKGSLGLAPEWREGKCDGACQERVSSCLAALTNQTGDHVQVDLLSAAPSLPAMGADDHDLPFPYQEGAFFGNVFAGEAYVCRGRDADKGAQLKRFCALAPALCSGIATFVDAGPCQQSCQMSCTQLSDGTSRCAAVSCRDPKGHLWTSPITTYMRDRIEAGNADAISGAEARNSGLERFQEGAQATYRHVDFGRQAGTIRSIVANVSAPTGGGQIELWSDGRRLGVVPVRSTGAVPADLTAPLQAQGLSGQHDLVLRFTGLRGDVRLADIGLR